MCNMRAWPQQCRKSCTNGFDIVALRFGVHGTKKMLGVVGSKLWPVSNFARQLATNNSQQASNNKHQNACNRVCKRTQRTLLHAVHVTTLRPFARGSRASKTGNFEDETPLESENLKISITLNSLFPEFYGRFDQFCLVSFNSTPCDTHFPSKSLVWEIFEVTSCSLFT